MPAFFSSAWADAAGSALNISTTYAEAAATWDGAVRLVARDAPGADGPLAVWLDLASGRCAGAQAGPDALAADAPFEIAGTYDVWRKVLGGGLDPLLGVMTGKLKLTGDMAVVAKHGKAAKEMVAAAATVETTPPV